MKVLNFRNLKIKVQLSFKGIIQLQYKPILCSFWEKISWVLNKPYF